MNNDHDGAARWVEDAGRFLEALNCGAVIIDRAGRITRANARLPALMGRPASALLGRSFLEFYDDPASRVFVLERRAHFDTPWEG